MYVVSVCRTVKPLTCTRVRVGCLGPATQLFDYLTERSQQYDLVRMYETHLPDDRSDEEKLRAEALLREAFA